MPVNRRRPFYTTLFAYTNNPLYKELMIGDNVSYSKEMNNQLKSKTQEENWVEMKVIKEKLKEYKLIFENLYKSKPDKNFTNCELHNMEKYVLLMLVSGVHIPVRRSMDFIQFKISGEIDKENDNYLDVNVMKFNSFKTAIRNGKRMKTTEIILLPPSVKQTLNKWISINPSNWLLFDKNNNQRKSVHITQILNSIFGKKVSTSMLRHIRTSEMYGGLLDNIVDEFKDMGSSYHMATTYIKKT